MKFGILITPGSHSQALAKKAEALGFDSAFFVDSPALFGDPFVSMAAAAVQTERIALAVGVTNPLTRSAPVAASSVAALNVLAPGRIILGIGVGDSATQAMGQRRATLAELETFIAQVRSLLNGKETEVSLATGETIVRFLNQRRPWINLEDPVPVYVASSAPKGLHQAGRIADAAILGGLTDPGLLEACRSYLNEGANEVGRQVTDQEIVITPSVYVTEQEPTFEHLKEVLGPKSLAPTRNFSRMANQSESVSPNLQEQMAAVSEAYEIRDDYQGDPKRRHLDTYQGYLTELKDWQQALITDDVLEATSIAGTVEQCLKKIAMLQKHGVDHIILSPLPQFLEKTMEVFGRDILPSFKN
jgi:alkanesulfonate monooxygenase SsuD/methylene tetrahydromethanopterin reductase-like flavin-dependent oxidoreductase (luciferase family)